MVIVAIFNSVLRGFTVAHEIITEAMELHRVLQKRYPFL